MKNVTVITTVYKTPELLIDLYTSLREFYPTVSLIIIDNSTDGSCSNLTELWMKEDQNLLVIENEENEGHGDGLHRGIRYSRTHYMFLCDSDVTFTKPNLLEDMMEKMSPEIYGVGWLLNLDMGGRNIPNDYKGEILKYLYPAFCLINRDQYYKFHKFTRFGLPPFKAMIELHKKKLTDELLIDFPVGTYLKHISGATRAKFGDCEDIVRGFTGKKGDMNSSYL